MAVRFTELGLALLLSGCSDGGDGTVVFAGALAGVGEAGRIELTVEASRATLAEDEDGSHPMAPQDGVPATALLTLPGSGALTLSGNYDPPSETLYIAGGGFVISGYLEHDLDPDEMVFEGLYHGPQGRGRVTLHEGRPEDVAVLCGQFAGSVAGRWAVALGPRITTAVAVPFDRDRRSHFLVGTVDGGSASFIEDDGGAHPVTASGLIAPDRTTAEGEWAQGENGGDWEALAADCAIP